MSTNIREHVDLTALSATINTFFIEHPPLDALIYCPNCSLFHVITFRSQFPEENLKLLGPLDDLSHRNFQ